MKGNETRMKRIDGTNYKPYVKCRIFRDSYSRTKRNHFKWVCRYLAQMFSRLVCVCVSDQTYRTMISNMCSKKQKRPHYLLIDMIAIFDLKLCLYCHHNAELNVDICKRIWNVFLLLFSYDIVLAIIIIRFLNVVQSCRLQSFNGLQWFQWLNFVTVTALCLDFSRFGYLIPLYNSMGLLFWSPYICLTFCIFFTSFSSSILASFDTLQWNLSRIPYPSPCVLGLLFTRQPSLEYWVYLFSMSEPFS